LFKPKKARDPFGVAGGRVGDWLLRKLHGLAQLRDPLFNLGEIDVKQIG